MNRKEKYTHIDLETSEKVDNGWGEVPERQSTDTNREEWLENLSPSDVVAVHVTNTFPSDDKIRSHTGWELETGEEGRVRDTVHFTLNNVVTKSHGGIEYRGSWEQRNFAVLSPLENFKKDQIELFSKEDTFVRGDFSIVEGSTILVHWESITTLRDKGLISEEELSDIFKRIGTEDQYVGTKHSPTPEISIEKNGIKYLICDLSGENFRDRLEWEIANMGYKYEGDRSDATSGFSQMGDKYDLYNKGTHDSHDEVGDEYCGIKVDTYLNKIISTRLLKNTFESKGYESEEASIEALENEIHISKKDMMGIHNQSETISETEWRTGNQIKLKIAQSLSETKILLEGYINNLADGKRRDMLLEFTEWIGDYKDNHYSEEKYDVDKTISKLKIIFSVRDLNNKIYNKGDVQYGLKELDIKLKHFICMLNTPTLNSEDKLKIVDFFSEIKEVLDRMLSRDEVDGKTKEGIIKMIEFIKEKIKT